MNQPSHEDLLGFVLGALDAPEQQQVQQWIDDNPNAEEELLALKAHLVPLEYVDSPSGPPPGLARRTCQAIAVVERTLPLGFSERGLDDAQCRFPITQSVARAAWQTHQRQTHQGQTHQGQSARASRRTPTDASVASRESLAVGRRMSWTDVGFSCAAAAILGALLMPALWMARFNSRVNQCQGNMLSLYRSLAYVAQQNDGKFVQIPTSGRLNAVGMFAPILKEMQLLESDDLLRCPGLGASADPVVIPTVKELEGIECNVALRTCQNNLCGHYGYSMGYFEDGQYYSPRCRGVLTNVIIADRPSCAGIGRMSPNHDRRLMNAVFEDGRMARLRKPFIGEDALFYNEQEMIGPGIDRFDNVIGNSRTLLFVQNSADSQSP